VPPLYHINLAEWSKRKQLIQTHYGFFSPLHRQAGLLPMTDFRWLSEDRMVQRTMFGDTLELVVNFRNEPFHRDGVEIPARTIFAKWIATGQESIFTPSTMLP
jgi:hypothetical protein